MADKIITHIEGLEKAKSFCAYQERCHKEVEEKLRTWKLTIDEIDYIVNHLLADDYLNEERFAMAYASGKFRIKQWGRKKIIQKLKEKKVSDYCIKKGLSEIDEEDYISTLRRLVEKRYSSLKDRNTYLRKRKTVAFLYGKGYESDLVWEQINALFD